MRRSPPSVSMFPNIQESNQKVLLKNYSKLGLNSRCMYVLIDISLVYEKNFEACLRWSLYCWGFVLLLVLLLSEFALRQCECFFLHGPTSSGSKGVMLELDPSLPSTTWMDYLSRGVSKY